MLEATGLVIKMVMFAIHLAEYKIMYSVYEAAKPKRHVSVKDIPSQ